MKNTIAPSYLLILLIVFFTPVLFAQEENNDPYPDVEDYDSLFTDDESDNPDEEGEKKEETVLDKLLGSNTKLDISASFQIYAGYSPGYNTLDSDDEDQEYTDMFLLGLNSNLALKFNISDSFQVFQRFNISYPDIELMITEFFADYSAADIIQFRIGLQKIRWGESKNFPFTDLPNRVPDDFGSLDKKNLAFKMTIPIGVGGIDLLAVTKLGYWEENSYPSAEDMGFGLKWNLALSPFDMNFGAFYRDGMNIRGFASVKTTLFGNVETYAEALVAIDPDWETNILENGNPDNPLDFGVNLGIYTDFFKQTFEIGAEFYYNGEESELTGNSSSFPILWGTNLCLYLALNAGKDDMIKIFAHTRYNVQADSLYLIPGLVIKLMKNLSLSCAGAVLLGNRGEGYSDPDINPDPLNREAFMIIRLIFNGSI
ncbi:MAG: hypothetical protein JW874_01635 [Spirochaetales bacterium]|nr:hypothetical protein [Spirochaetales bacterium]